VSEQNKQVQDNSRRAFLKTSGAALGGVVVGGVLGKVLGGGGGNAAVPPAVEHKAAVDYNQALMFFNQEQFQVAQAAAERIYPKDEQGPGAIELGVAYFIDHQMASPWGYNGKDYMSGPFEKGVPTQGYQSRLTRNQIITIGMQGLQDYSKQKYQKNYFELTPEQQDETLKAFEKGDGIKLPGTTPQDFFSLFRTFTIEGVYADPMYGGNKDMAGWKMRSFPGNQGNYTEQIEKTGLVKIAPQSLHDHMSH
jgi:gluconate 2-dehydrogenase gamma chain